MFETATTLRCVFCGRALPAGACIWVRLLDGQDFVCCPSACEPMVGAIESYRRELSARRHQLSLPLGAS
jgi:hypothetical protein